MDVDEVRKLLRERCGVEGGQATWAFMHGVSPAYVSDVLNKRREPGPALLHALGVRKIVTYEWKA